MNPTHSALAASAAWALVLLVVAAAHSSSLTQAAGHRVMPLRPEAEARISVAPSINIHDAVQSADTQNRRLLQTNAGKKKAEIAALQALLLKYPCDEGCNGHGKCETLAHLSDTTRPPIKEASIHGRLDLAFPGTHRCTTAPHRDPSLAVDASVIGRHGQGPRVEWNAPGLSSINQDRCT